MNIFSEEQKDAINFIRFLYLKRRTIILTVIAAVVLTGIITFFIPPKFYSFAVVFPTESNKVEDVLKDPKFGYDTHADQLLQMLESEQLRDSVVKRFDLVHYYGVDTATIDWKQKLDQEYIEDVTARRTKYMSVVISATTKEPKLSASIVNAIIDYVNEFRSTIFHENRKKALDAAQKAYEDQASTMEDLRKQIYAMKDTTDAHNILYNQVESSGDRVADINFVNNPRLEKLVYSYRFALTRSQALREDYIIAQEQYNEPLPSVFEVDRAKPSYKKASPSYSVNLSVAFFGSLVLSIIALYLLHKVREIKASV